MQPRRGTFFSTMRVGVSAASKGEDRDVRLASEVLEGLEIWRFEGMRWVGSGFVFLVLTAVWPFDVCVLEAFLAICSTGEV